MRTRPGTCLLLAAGLTIGSMADNTTESTPVRAPEGVVLTADLHVHAFPGDGVLPAWQLRREAKRRGIDVIAITNHNQSIAASLPAGGARGELPLVIAGQEITTPAFHLVAAGVRQVVDWRLPLREAIEAIHAQGGVAIAAHPIERSWRVRDAAALAALDGVEAVHGGEQSRSPSRYQLRDFYRRTQLLNPSLAAIGASDFHAIGPLGKCLTYIIADEVSEEGVLRAIRQGQTVASDRRDTFVGDPALVQSVRKATAERAPAVASDFWRQLSVMMVLGALVLLVCLR